MHSLYFDFIVCYIILLSRTHSNWFIAAVVESPPFVIVRFSDVLLLYIYVMFVCTFACVAKV
jgi:hypothetical protein